MTHALKALTIAALALALFARPAAAEDAAKPSSSTETYEAWNLACTATAAQAPAAPKKDDANKTATADPAKKDVPKDAAPAAEVSKQICEVSQVYSNQKTSNEVARVSFFYDGQKKDQIIAALRVLVDASFEKPVQIMDGDTELLKGSFRRCIGNFCYAVFDGVSGQLDKIYGATKLALVFPIGSGQQLRIPMSPKGLSGAMAALKSRQ